MKHPLFLFRGSGFAIGHYSDIALDVLQREYSPQLSINEAIALSSKAMEKALDEGPQVETGVVTTKDGMFRKITNGQYNE